MQANKGAASGYASLNSSGIVPTAELGTGIAGSANFLRGDGTWVAPNNSGGGTTATFTTAGIVKQTVFNVRDYGAVGDGVADDTTAISSAMTALNAAGGGTLLIPSNCNCLVSASTTLSSNTHLIVDGSITVSSSWNPGSAAFVGIFELGTSGGIISNVEIEGGLITGTCFTSAYTTNSPTFNSGNIKYIVYIHSVATLINVRAHDFHTVNIGSPLTYEKLGASSTQPSYGIHSYNILEEQSWVGVQYYCNGYSYQDVSIHDVTVNFCYDDCVAIVGATGGISGATGTVNRVQVYNIRGNKTGQTGAFVKLDATGGSLSDVNVANITGYTTGVGEYFIANIGATDALNKKYNFWGLQAQGNWSYGVYLQTLGRTMQVSNFYFEALYGIHLQSNAIPANQMDVKLHDGTIFSRNASLADIIEGEGIGFSAGTSGQGFQNVHVENVSTYDKAVPINEGNVDRAVSDGVISSLINTFQLSSATANFTSADIGRTITINGAGASGANLVTGIASIVSTTVVNLGAACQTTVSGATVTILYVPFGTGVQGTYTNMFYSIDTRNSAPGACVFSSTNRTVRFFTQGTYVGDTAFALLTSPTSGHVLTSDSLGNGTWQAVTATTNANLTGPVTSVGNATSITALAVTNAMLAGSIAASKLIGTDITTVGTVTAGTWAGTTIAIANGGTGSTSQNFVDLTTAQTIAGKKSFSTSIATPLLQPVTDSTTGFQIKNAANSLDFGGYAAACAQACWTSMISWVDAGRAAVGINRAAMIWRRSLVSMS
ncbi:MAG TPA: glycosyl hydrolase family 28-related protein, partial [Ktedonobacteraceae bacterium]|nr:glycosyl hydrolase family 28-related protein [Ktedonobacteraceae bacterium]